MTTSSDPSDKAVTRPSKAHPDDRGEVVGGTEYRFSADWSKKLESEVHWRLYWKQQDLLSRVLEKGDTVMELGVGTGFTANYLRSKGHEASERIQADADRQRSILIAEAYRDSEIVRGEGDARATEIYAQAFSKDQEFYQLYRSITAYTKNFSSAGDVILLQPDSDYFRYFKDPSGKKK